MECEICLSDLNEESFLHLKQSCNQHLVCNDCFSQHCLHTLRDLARLPLGIRCPGKRCHTIIDDSSLKLAFHQDSNLMDKYHRIEVEKTLLAMEDVVNCPKCHSFVVLFEKKSKSKFDDNHRTGRSIDGVCANCKIEFCIKCKKHPHFGYCVDGEIYRPPQEVVQWIQEFTRKCPVCRIPIEKNGGCNNMLCLRCRRGFSWENSLKGSEIPLPMKGDKILSISSYRLKLNTISQKCPNCQRAQKRESNENNHLKCNNCQTKFCFHCGLAVRSTFHFNTNSGCPQHGSIKSTCDQHHSKMKKKRIDKIYLSEDEDF